MSCLVEALGDKSLLGIVGEEKLVLLEVEFEDWLGAMDLFWCGTLLVDCWRCVGITHWGCQCSRCTFALEHVLHISLGLRL